MTLPPTVEFFDEPILAIESSCDETSAAVVVGRQVRSNVIASQIEMHRKWGGIVPEAAARAHVEAILPVIQEALSDAYTSLAEIGAFAVTNRPGLIGALSVGLSSAKALAHATGKPLIGIHHLEGHLLSVFGTDQEILFPHLALIVSGGHTELVLVSAPGKYAIVGETRDDAAGEAFDKTARLLGLGYPGGFAIQELARTGNPNRYPLPRGLSGNTFEFSFSGLKTAVMRLVEREGDQLCREDAAASLQQAVVSVLVDRGIAAAERCGVEMVTLVGGVAANESLRTELSARCIRSGMAFVTPPLTLCTDNAAMIGLAASTRLARREADDHHLDAQSNADLAEHLPLTS